MGILFLSRTVLWLTLGCGGYCWCFGFDTVYYTLLLDLCSAFDALALLVILPVQKSGGKSAAGICRTILTLSAYMAAT